MRLRRASVNIMLGGQIKYPNADNEFLIILAIFVLTRIKFDYILLLILIRIKNNDRY